MSQDVVFDEEKGWNWSKEGVEKQNDGSFVVTVGRFGDHDLIEGEDSDTTSPNAVTDVEEAEEPDKPKSFVPKQSTSEEIFGEDQPQNLRRSERQTHQPKYLEDYILLAEELGEELLRYLNNEPKNFGEAKGLNERTRACEDEIESIERNKTWDLVDLPYGAKPIGLKWVFKLKRNADGSINKFKARLVAKGYVQQYGIDFNEVFEPVARLETIRLRINLAATNGWEVHHLDVKTAFLHGELKETFYVCQPEGFEKKGCGNKVYKLNKALYGLRQAPRAWNNKLNQILMELKFSKCTKEPFVYRKNIKGELLVVAVYVDDLFVTGTSKKLIDEFKDGMASKFDMSDLGRLTYYLGIEVCQDDQGITLNQSRYAATIFENAGLADCNPVQAPMELGLNLSKAEEEKEIDATSFRRNIFCLRYLLHTRLDLSFAVGVLSRYMHSPRESHEAALKQCLRYLQGSMRYILVFDRSPLKIPRLVGYSENKRWKKHNQPHFLSRKESYNMVFAETRHCCSIKL